MTSAAMRWSELVSLVGKHQLRSALDSGVLCQPWRGVVIHAEHALDLRTRCAAAVLAVGEGAVISGPTAVALHGYSSAKSPSVHVTVPYLRSPRRRPGLVIHQKDIRNDNIVQLGDLPVLSHSYALAEFLCDGDKWDAFASLDQALAGLHASAMDALKTEIRAHLDQRQDPRGIHRGLLLSDLATGLADSPPESIFRLIVIEAGFPIPEPQIEIRTIDGRVLYVLDMGWESVRTALEYDGYAAHEDRETYDAERDRRLAARGWVIVRATAADLRDSSRVIAELRAAFARHGR